MKKYEKKEFMFSVLMSVYTKENPKYLEKAIDSILHQTIIPDEFVIVKDGALNKALDTLLKKYSENYPFIKLVQLNENVGLGRALNEGLKHCSYDYVARMDSDDISIQDRFEKQINFLKKNPKCDLIGGNIMEFDDETGKDISLRKVPNNSLDILKFLKKRNPVNHVTVMFKKKSVLEVGSYMDCPYFEDYYLWARMVKNKMNLININDVLVRVRAGVAMSNRRGHFKYIKSIFNFENKLLKLGLINIFMYIFNVLSRSIVALVPNKIRYYIYQEKLRDENK